ncbi:hypothetical protein HUO09_17650 [Vibrio sp. Y2-5]|uniref:hypothetical protein n=1 Tax=Vibrio sp. Y2-5 TaxID=2743977 RepID=UPI001660998B|nr:hypothetical protein [Vibrio sp. Y2-5]MBD0788183.1 hypothetical protein [Vibrio sp. Y2-5]
MIAQSLNAAAEKANHLAQMLANRANFLQTEEIEQYNRKFLLKSLSQYANTDTAHHTELTEVIRNSVVVVSGIGEPHNNVVGNNEFDVKIRIGTYLTLQLLFTFSRENELLSYEIDLAGENQGQLFNYFMHEVAEDMINNIYYSDSGDSLFDTPLDKTDSSRDKLIECFNQLNVAVCGGDISKDIPYLLVWCSKDSQPSSRVVCAPDQDKAWEIHKKDMQNKFNLDESSLNLYHIKPISELTIDV